MRQRPLGAGRAYGPRRLQNQSPFSLVTLLVHFEELIYLATHIIFILAESKTTSAKSARILTGKENLSSGHNPHPLTEGAVTEKVPRSFWSLAVADTDNKSRLSWISRRKNLQLIALTNQKFNQQSKFPFNPTKLNLLQPEFQCKFHLKRSPSQPEQTHH